MEKKDAAITIHLPSNEKRKLDRLAARKGWGAGEYVLNELIIAHLETLESEARLMHEILELQQNDQNLKNCSQ